VGFIKIRIAEAILYFFFFFLSSTTLCEFWLAQLFLSMVSFPVPSVSNYLLQFSSNRLSRHHSILILAFLSVLLRVVSIYKSESGTSQVTAALFSSAPRNSFLKPVARYASLYISIIFLLFTRSVIYQQFYMLEEWAFLCCFVPLQNCASQARLTRSAGGIFAPHFGTVAPLRHE